jgi:hypothetical protein
MGFGRSLERTQKGKRDALLVERNYKLPAYLQQAYEMTLYFSRDGWQDLVKSNDAIGYAIEEVNAKNGRVICIRNNILMDFDHVAMLLRYNGHFLIKVEKPIVEMNYGLF